MRLLLITYYFPPCGGAAVQRWLKWLPELVANGFEVTVLTTLDGDYPVRDESLLSTIPPQVKVIRVAAPRWEKTWKTLAGDKSALPYGSLSQASKSGVIKRTLVWLRLNLIIPDLRKFWNPQAFKAAVKLLHVQPMDIVITTGPPHSTHLLGLKLKQRCKAKWVADWRDPWTTIHYLQLNPPAPLAMRIHRRLERRVAENSDLNITVSEHLAKHLPGRRNVTIYNGFDARQFERLAETEPLKEMDKVFRLKYVGSVTEGQDLETMLRTVSEALNGIAFEIVFVGTKLDPMQKALLERYMPGRYSVKGFAAHAGAVLEMRSANVLLLLINYYPGAEGMLTTKLFEYLATGVKILCLGPKGGEAEKLIRSYEAGSCFDRDEQAEATEYLRGLYNSWQRGEDISNHRDISVLSSQNQALKLIEELRALKSD